MPRMNIYVPDDLHDRMQPLDLNWSAIAQSAFARAVLGDVPQDASVFAVPALMPESLRDYFAAQAITGIVAQFYFNDSFDDEGSPIGAAIMAYAIADAMLAERAKAQDAGGEA